MLATFHKRDNVVKRYGVWGNEPMTQPTSSLVSRINQARVDRFSCCPEFPRATTRQRRGKLCLSVRLMPPPSVHHTSLCKNIWAHTVCLRGRQAFSAMLLVVQAIRASSLGCVAALISKPPFCNGLLGSCIGSLALKDLFTVARMVSAAVSVKNIATANIAVEMT